MNEAVRPAGPAPACPGPDPKPHPATRFTVPAGAVDTHAHVIGLPPHYPLVAQRSYTPPAASPAAYAAMLDATGMAHGVLVQVSVHGTDNRLMLETLRANPRRLKGIAVVDPDRPERGYADLKDAGVVGLRLNVLYGGGIGFDQLDRTADICADMGWHVEFLLDARDLTELAPRLRRLRAPIVIDHMGHFPAAAGVTHPGFEALLSLARDGAWIKLSGAYRLSVDGSPYRDTIAIARAVVDAAAARCVWGSDWPHVANWDHMPNVGDLLDLFVDWVPDADTRRRILVDNARRLYGLGEGHRHCEPQAKQSTKR